MKCVSCGGSTITTCTWKSNNGYVRRRKECLKCGMRFSTYEFSDEVVQEVISMLDGRRNVIMQLRKRLPKFYPNYGKKKKSANDQF